MLYAIAGEDLNLSAIQRYWYMNNDFAIRLLQYLPQAFIEVQLFGSLIESGSLLLPGIFFLFQHQ